MRTLSILSYAILLFLCAGFASAQQSDRDRGIDLYRDGKFPDAIVLLEKATASDETDRAAWQFLGGAYFHTGEEGKAANAFGKSAATPTSPQPKYDRSVQVTYNPRPKYTDEAKANMTTGKVRVAVEFRADGSIGFAVPLETSIDKGLVQQSVESARAMKFEPALKNGKPVTTIRVAEYGFYSKRPI